MDQFPVAERRLGFRKYPELIQDSDLHKVFHGIQVRSIGRVFRMAEIPTANGAVKVVSMKRLMRDARSKYPQRARSGYENVVLPDHMENCFLLQFNPKADLERLAQMLLRRPEIEAVLFDYRGHQRHHDWQNRPGFGAACCGEHP